MWPVPSSSVAVLERVIVERVIVEEGIVEGTASRGSVLGSAVGQAVGLPEHITPRLLLARRATSEVWLARDRLRGRDVVVKVLHGRHAQRRAEMEARAMARLGSHPHVLEVFGIGVDRCDRAWVVTAHAHGGTLAAATHCPPIALLRWGREVASALSHAHACGVAHGDVTPANVLLLRAEPRGSGVADGALVAVLGDFGSAAIDGSAAVGGSSGAFGFTPRFSAPERIRGAAPTPCSDVFGLARSIVEAAGGSVDGIGWRARRVLQRALDPDPGARPSAEVVSKRLR